MVLSACRPIKVRGPKIPGIVSHQPIDQLSIFFLRIGYADIDRPIIDQTEIGHGFPIGCQMGPYRCTTGRFIEFITQITLNISLGTHGGKS